MAGTALALSEHFRQAKLYTVEPYGLDDTARSLSAGKRQTNDPSARSICDAIVTPMPGELTFPIVQKLARSGLSVSDEQALQAMRVGWDYFKLTIEPGGAVALAAALSDAFLDQFQATQSGSDTDKRRQIIVMASGGNCDSDMFMRALDSQPKY